MKFKLDIEMDNAAFEEFPEKELIRILRNTEDQIRNGKTYGNLIDYNGNSCGQWGIIE